jgi:N-acetylneuraminic acid mutarotase
MAGIGQPAGLWSFEKGNPPLPSSEIFGTKGIFSPDNRPAATEISACWTEGGKAYLFGGGGPFGILNNDLWEFDPLLKQWRWLKGQGTYGARGQYGALGVAAPGNTPGARKNATAIHANGKLYLFGGNGIDRLGNQGLLSDFWEYDISSGLWRWLKGSDLVNQLPLHGTLGIASPAATPGGRAFSPGWYVGMRFYLFGGRAKTAPSGLSEASFSDLWELDLNTLQWKWIKGPSSPDQFGIYGTLQVPDAGNNPGARKGASGAAYGNQLFLFGGEGVGESGALSGYLNDLWTFDINTSQWVWKKGSSTPDEAGVYGTQGIYSGAVEPGSRVSHLLAGSGSLFLWGGEGYGNSTAESGYLSDVFEFDPGSGNWRWISGNSNINTMPVYGDRGVSAAGNSPGARMGSAIFVFANEWIITGGHSLSSNYANTNHPLHYNDTWLWNRISNEYTWAGGTNGGTTFQESVIEVKGAYGLNNLPSGRSRFGACSDESGNLYVFGGFGKLPGEGLEDAQNDLWQYDEATQRWRILSGDSVPFVQGVYGTKGSFSANNKPGSRVYPVLLKAGNSLYLFGGFGYGKTLQGNLNDLWEFNLLTNQWRWLSGSDDPDAHGTYGTRGVAQAANTPGGRERASGFVSNGKLYFFGGLSFDESGNFGSLNDLWQYNPVSGFYTWIAGDKEAESAGSYGTKGVGSATTKPGARYSSAVALHMGKLMVHGGYGNDQNSNAGFLNDLWEYDFSLNQWKWVSGDEVSDVPGTYLSKGNPSVQMYPGGRSGANMVSLGDRLLLFAGRGLAASQQIGLLNDLWRFNPALSTWEWALGSSTIDERGFLTNASSADTGNAPGARQEGFAYAANAGLRVFGGSGYDVSRGYAGNQSDFWKLNACQIITPVSQSTERTTQGVEYGSFFYGNGCDILARVQPNGASPANGFMRVRAFVQPNPQRFNGVLTVQRHFDISAAADPENASARLTLYFTQQEFDAFNATPDHGPDLPRNPTDAAGKANLLVSQIKGSSISGLPDTYPGPDSIINPNDNDLVWNQADQRWELTFNVRGFSGFFVHTVNNSLLPIALARFMAIPIQKDASIRWTTSFEQAASHFVLQRGRSARDFEPIARLSARNRGATEEQYAYLDRHPGEGNFFYRLQMVDLDGRTAYSHIQSVRFGPESPTVRLANNPTRNNTRVLFSGNPTQAGITVSNSAGKIIWRWPITATQTVELPASEWPVGLYFIHVHGQKINQVLKLIRN